MNGQTAGGTGDPGSAASDPLLGWAALDACGRVLALGGRLAGSGRLCVGQPLADALREAGAVSATLAALVSAPAAALTSAQHCRVQWRPAVDGEDRPAAAAGATGAAGPAPESIELILRSRRAPSGEWRMAAEFWREGCGPAGRGEAPAPEVLAPLLAPPPLVPGSSAAADLWAFGTALYAATIVPVVSRPTGIIRFALHPVALPRLRAVDELDPWLAVALQRLAASARKLGTEAVAARTGVRELTVWLRDGTACGALCERWLAEMNASALVGRERRLVVGPAAAWCVVPADGQVLGHLFDALDAALAATDARSGRPPIPVSSLARERDIDERREPLTETLVELAGSGRARLSAEPIVDAPTGLVCGLDLRAEFRSLFALSGLIDDLPDIIEDEAAADALNAWAAGVVAAAVAPGRAAPLPVVQVRISPAQLQRMDSLAALVRALQAAMGEGAAAPCLLLPEAAVHRNAYLVIDAAAEVAALGAQLGIDDYRGLLPPAQFAQAGIRTLRLHRSLVRELAERRFAQERLADLLARARACAVSVLVAGLAEASQLAAAHAAGALQVAGPLFGRAQRLDGAAPLQWPAAAVRRHE